VAGVTPAISFLVPKPFGNLIGVLARDVFHVNLVQAMIGGGSTAEEPLPGIKDSSLVPWSLCASDLDREVPSDSGGEGLADLTFTECCVGQTEGEGASFFCSSHFLLDYI
jgi:hypothetical protein